MSAGGWHFDIQNPLITKWAPPATRASKLVTFDAVFESLSKMRKRDQKWGPRGKSLSVVQLCIYVCMYVSMGVGPYIHKYIRKNVTSKPKSSQNVGPNENGSRMYTNMAGFTDVHKYENRPQTYTNTSLLTYIST